MLLWAWSNCRAWLAVSAPAAPVGPGVSQGGAMQAMAFDAKGNVSDRFVGKLCTFVCFHCGMKGGAL